MFISSEKNEASARCSQIDFGEKGMSLLQGKQYTQAYIFLTQALLEAPEDASVFFNLGLCCLFAGNAEKALQYLETGIEKLNVGPLPQELRADVPMMQQLERQEAETDAYKAPMYSFETSYFFKRTKDRFLRLMVDGYVLTNNYLRVKQIADMLQNKSYKNVQAALEKI